MLLIFCEDSNSFLKTSIAASLNREKTNKNKQAKDIRYENSSESTNARQRKQGRMLVNSAKLNIIASIIKFEESMSKISEPIELRFPATNE